MAGMKVYSLIFCDFLLYLLTHSLFLFVVAIVVFSTVFRHLLWRSVWLQHVLFTTRRSSFLHGFTTLYAHFYLSKWRFCLCSQNPCFGMNNEHPFFSGIVRLSIDVLFVFVLILFSHCFCQLWGCNSLCMMDLLFCRVIFVYLTVPPFRWLLKSDCWNLCPRAKRRHIRNVKQTRWNRNRKNRRNKRAVSRSILFYLSIYPSRSEL